MITLALQRSALRLLLPLLAGTALAQEPPDAPGNAPGPGKGIYEKACAACHAAPTEARVPTFAALTALPANQLNDAMAEGGKMAPMAAALSMVERAQLIEFLTAGQGSTIVWTEPLACAPDKRGVDVK